LPCSDEDRATPLATEGKALDKAQEHQQGRRERADAGIRGQQADPEGRAAHISSEMTSSF
jgi:hypothetical protein